MKFSEAWNIIKQYISREMAPLAGQEGTAEMWEALDVVEKKINSSVLSGEPGVLDKFIEAQINPIELLHYEMFVGYTDYRWRTIYLDARNDEEAEAKALEKLTKAGEDDVAFVGVYHVREPEEDIDEDDEDE